MSVSFPPEHLSFHTDMAGEHERKDVLDWSSEITEGWGEGWDSRLLRDLPGHTRDLGHEVLTGCGGKRTRQILSWDYTCLFSKPASPALPPLPPPTHTQPAPRLDGKCPGAQGLSVMRTASCAPGLEPEYLDHRNRKFGI